MRVALFIVGLAAVHSAYGMNKSAPRWKSVFPLGDPSMPPVYITFERLDMNASRLGAETGPTAVFRLHNNTAWALGVLSVVLETSANASNFGFVKVTNGSVRAVKNGSEIEAVYHTRPRRGDQPMGLMGTHHRVGDIWVLPGQS